MPGPASYENPEARREWQQQRGLGGFVRSSWDEVNQLIASANVYTAKKYGPDRVVGFSPIPVHVHDQLRGWLALTCR